MADSPVTRELRTLPVPGGVAVTALFRTFEQLLAACRV